MNSFALVKYLNVDELIDVHDDSWSVTNQKDDHDANQNYAGSDILTRNTIRSDSSSEIRFLLTVSCTFHFRSNRKLFNRMCTHQTNIKRNGKITDFDATWAG